MIHAESSGSEIDANPIQTGFASRMALTTFVVLFTMNLLDYTDRWILTAVLPQLQNELKFDDYHAGWLSTYFLISYSIVGPIMGYAGDRFKRTRLLAIGVGLWSVATLCTGLATSYNQLAIARGFLGVGEATYGMIAPTMLLDLFSRRVRSQLLSIFYIAMPLGGAIGYVLGSQIASRYSWQLAFYVVGFPGLIAAIAVLFLPEPVRGATEEVAPDRLALHEKAGPSKDDYFDLMVNSSYTYSVLGMAFYTFAIGGMAFFLPKFLIIAKGYDQKASGLAIGGVTLCAAVIGMSSGGWLADKLSKKSERALFIVPGIAMLMSIPFVLSAIYSQSQPMVYASIFMAQALMFINTGPCNAVIANVVMPNMRAAAYGVSVFAVHFLGDIWSPPLMGWVSTTFAAKDGMATIFGQGLTAIGATPSFRENFAPANLSAAMLLVVPALLLSGIVLISGARHLPGEMALMRAKLKAAPVVAKS